MFDSFIALTLALASMAGAWGLTKDALSKGEDSVADDRACSTQ